MLITCEKPGKPNWRKAKLPAVHIFGGLTVGARRNMSIVWNCRQNKIIYSYAGASRPVWKQPRLNIRTEQTVLSFIMELRIKRDKINAIRKSFKNYNHSKSSFIWSFQKCIFFNNRDTTKKSYNHFSVFKAEVSMQNDMARKNVGDEKTRPS